MNLPSLFFVTSLSLFIYFFALIVMEEESDSTNLLKSFFWVFNLVTYLAFFVISYSRKYRRNNNFITDMDNIYYVDTKFLKALCGLFGIVYLIFALCMTNYGTKLSIILSQLQDDSDSDENRILKTLNTRVRTS